MRVLATGLAALLPIGCYSGFDGDPSNQGGGGPSASGPSGGNADGGESGGGTDDSGDVPPTGCGGQPVSVASRPMRRLTPIQYASTMRDLLGDPGFVAEYDDIEPVPTERGIRQLRTGAEGAIERIDQWSASLVPCDINGAEDAACPGAVIDTFAPKAFRRPVTDEERTWLTGVYNDASSQGFQSGMEALLATILQAPEFVYHVEVGTPIAGSDSIRALTDYEVASRLSYFLWDSLPDDALFDAAAAGTLTTEDGVRAQVERMSADPRAQAKMQAFVWSWLQLDGGRAHFALGEQTKSAEYYPEYSPQLVDAMGVEVESLVQRVLENGGNFSELLTSRDAYVNAPLAELYEVANGPADADTWEWVQLDPTVRSGLLTRAAFLSTFASPAVQSPIRRGVYVFEELLCGHLGDPPPNASDVPVEGGDVEGEVLSVREEVELRTQEAECASCHQVINNIGFAFEHYDAVGRWRAAEVTSGKTIDSSGRLIGSDVDADVADAIQITDLLAGSTQVEACFADRWVVEALGSVPGEADDCAVNELRDRFAETGSIVELMVAIAASDTFRYINTEGE